MQGDRLKAAAGVVLLHALLGYAFLTGLAYDVVREAGQTLKLFEIAAPPPPPVERPRPVEAPTPEPEGAAAPPGLAARPTPVVAPPPELRLEAPTPIVTAPTPAPLPPGPDRSAGAADRVGPGWGAGGQGAGTGSGAGGNGSGAGEGDRIARSARQVRGRIGNADYPRELERAGIGGSVDVRFIVGPDGRAGDCVTLRSSGTAELDRITCALIERRFGFRPAEDAAGRPVAEELIMTYHWRVRSRLPPPYP